MKISIILAHPNPKSFNHAIALSAEKKLNLNGHEVIFHDLYAEEFDPILFYREIPEKASLPPLVEQHCNEISSAEGIIVVHPNWWGQPPAILKGWVDRVIRPNVAYRFRDGDCGEGVPLGLLSAKVALVFNTSNTPAKREAQAFGDPLETLWRNCVFGLCGVNSFYRRTFSVIVTSTRSQRKQWLLEVKTVINQFFP